MVTTETTKPKKMIHLTFFDSACAGNHMNAGQWKKPGDATRDKSTLDYWLWMAKLAEKGKISCIFLADAYGGHETYTGTMDPVLRGGTQIGYLDPYVLIPAMASVTESVGFAVTGSTSYIPANINNRSLGALDHLSKGRVGWNIVTSWSKAAAKAFGKKDTLPHDERYTMTDEYMDLMYEMWNGAYADDAQVWDTVNNIAYEPSKTRRIKFEGKYVSFDGLPQTIPSPQRTPFLFQAGTSKAGMAFAAKHAEGIYLGGLLPSGSKDAIAATRAAAAANGRDPASVLAMIGFCPILGRTLEEAQAKYEDHCKYADPIAGLAQFVGYSGIDLTDYPLDDELSLDSVKMDSGNAIHAILRALGEGDPSGKPWTPRRIGLKQAMGGFHPLCVGTPAMVADHLEEWIDIADVDGFNVSFQSNPGSFEDVVELLVPELQARGLMQTEYAVPGGTLRENMTRIPGQKQLAEEHYGAGFKWDRTHDADGKFLGRRVDSVVTKENGELEHPNANGVAGEKAAEIVVPVLEKVNSVVDGVH